MIWLETDPQREPRYASLYASHRKMVDRVAETMHQHVRARRSTTHPKPFAFAYPTYPLTLNHILLLTFL